MSHYDNQEQQDYEEPDNTVSYTLSFVEGSDTVEVIVNHPYDGDEVSSTLADPDLLKTLNDACRGILDNHLKAQDEEREFRRMQAAADAEYYDVLNQSL